MKEKWRVDKNEFNPLCITGIEEKQPEIFEGNQDGLRSEKSKNVDVKDESGRKFDEEKIRFSLIPIDSIIEVVKVLEFGAKKYEVNNWNKVDKASERYYDAALRHILLGSGSGELDDPESGYKHTAHAICCLLFKLHFELQESKK